MDQHTPETHDNALGPTASEPRLHAEPSGPSEILQVQIEPKLHTNGGSISRYLATRISRCKLRPRVVSPLTCRHRRPCACESVTPAITPAAQPKPAPATQPTEPPTGPTLGAVVDCIRGVLAAFPEASPGIERALEPIFRYPDWRELR